MFDWIITPFTIDSNSILINGTYNYWLVGLSIVIAMTASFIGLQIAFQTAASASAERKQTMLLLGSIALGGGIWTMHFIGMLAFNLSTKVHYGWELTLLSLLPSIAASWVILNHISRHERGIISLLTGGFLAGSGISTMHYTGMAAARFVKPSGFELRQQIAESSQQLALAVSFATLVIILLVFGINLIYRYKYISQRALESERQRLPKRLKRRRDTHRRQDFSAGRCVRCPHQ